MFGADIAIEIVSRENRLARSNDSRFDSERRTMAMMVLAAYGFTSWEFADSAWEMSGNVDGVPNSELNPVPESVILKEETIN